MDDDALKRLVQQTNDALAEIGEAQQKLFSATRKIEDVCTALDANRTTIQHKEGA